MSIFDPLGLLAHYTIQGKILLQDIWKSKIEWDEELSEVLFRKWLKWIDQLSSVSTFRIPRCYSGENTKVINRQLHIFCDASGKSYAAVAYFRLEFETGEIDTSLVMAKARVSPLKALTIPRMELQAAVMASRLSEFIKKECELDIDEIHFWSDSKTVIYWLRSETKNFKIFVGHRIGEILELTDVYNWHWISTKENVADLATRDEKPADLNSVSLWTNGPAFLQQSKDDWPEDKTISRNEVTENLELKAEIVATIQPIEPCLPDISRFSSWLKLIRSTAWLLKAIQLFGKKSEEKRLLLEDLKNAEILWLRYVQQQSFPEEVSALKNEKKLKKNSHLNSLSVYLDGDGLLRLKGRTQNSPAIEESAKCPVILPQKHPYTRLLIDWFHITAGHHGQERVLNDLRKRFWIIRARTAVKYAWHDCQKCKNWRARPQVPEMGQLPIMRLTPSVRPFTYTGVDYFGPLEIVIGRRHEKRYGAIFTCLTMRAVHLELAASLNTDSAIMAIRRFISRRGNPVELHSDNGTNFHGADNELRIALQQFDQEKIETDLASRGIKWFFIPPASPNFGGCWERLVQSVKVALKATLKERVPREEVLQTLFAEAENTVNSRPLTHVSLDPDDPPSLTPNDILIGPVERILPPGIFDEKGIERKQWRYSQQLADPFWKRWVQEYLPTLTRREKWCERVEPIKIGDIVVIADNTLERNSWPLGRITATFPGKDGQVRVVEVKTESSLFRRPVSKICVLDVMKKGVGVDPSCRPNTGVENVVVASEKPGNDYDNEKIC